MSRILILMLCVSTAAIGQREWRAGTLYNFGASTILAKSGSGSEAHGISPELGFKPAGGAGLKGEFYFSPSLGIFIQSAYQQRGALYKNYPGDYRPRYRLHYWDAAIGGAFRRTMNEKGNDLFANLGFSYNVLLSADRVYESGSDNISNNISASEPAIFIGAGSSFRSATDNFLQLLIFSNYSPTEVYRGDLKSNGMKGRNFSMGIQLSWLFGKSKSE